MEAYGPPLTTRCCLCGSSEALSGEHKIKASALRSVFGDQKTVVIGDGGQYRYAQSSKSRAFHFAARVCEPCNSARTRPADLAFDVFNSEALDLHSRGRDPSEVFLDRRFVPYAGHLYLDVCRYFAKLMCCHLAEMDAPYLQGIAEFAIGSSDHNVVSLTAGLDVAYQRMQTDNQSRPYAAHGGLVVTGDRATRAPTSFYSTLTIRAVRYSYFVSYNELGQHELRTHHPDFYEWCVRRVDEMIANPLNAETKLLLGLPIYPEDPPP